MIRNVLQYLENSSEKFADKIAFDDDEKTISFGKLKFQAQSIGSQIAEIGCFRKPVVVYLPKGCDCIAAFMGIVYSGGFYCPIDVTMPLERVRNIITVLESVVIITNEKYAAKAEQFAEGSKIIIFENAIRHAADTSVLNSIRKKSIDTDPLYVLFTSGSTGIPKGVLISHKSVIDFTENAAQVLKLDSSDVLGNQGNFYFDLSVPDIYCSLKCGNTVCIIPKKKFLFPIDLLKYLNEKKITAINWVPSAISNVANLSALEVVTPVYLKKVFFCGEIMPNKQLNIWRKKLPDIVYINLYGPTEIVYACTYHIVTRTYMDDEVLPIGIPFENTRIFVLNEKDELVKEGEVGELCVAGASLALGYYNNPQKTAEVFVQNPLNATYEEKIYRTGDLVKYNSNGELIYISRKDFQIKHMGHRIELGEIETAVGDISDIENCVCVYDEDIQAICMCYTGKELAPSFIKEHLKKKLSSYMIPQKIFYFDSFLYNMNGKIDRIALLKIIQRENIQS